MSLGSFSGPCEVPVHGGTDHAVSTEDIGTTAEQDRSLCGGIPGYLRDIRVAAEKNEASGAIRARVEQAREIQKERFMEEKHPLQRGDGGAAYPEILRSGEGGGDLYGGDLRKACASARMHDRILKVARTTADLAGASEIRLSDLCEAVSYVKSREKFWGINA